MAIPAGTKLGTYEVTSHIGSGGMGEVYQAHDSKLGRDVAIKVLPEQFARDPERLARFQREAKMLAQLNHPNIAAIYGLEQSGNTHYLVMELVPGQTLAQRIRVGAIPVDEALPIARQIADAVEYAHDKNVIHRDLKPANIKVTAEGTVKVLDFGLAKALSDEVAAEDMSNSPTLSMAATRQGVILGTAAYMSPEQAKGKTVDRRTDVWAFGAVLFEMLTGKQAFPGEDITEVLAAVVRAEPDWNSLPSRMPAAIRVLLRRCLDKNLKRRLMHIGEARILLEDILSGAVSAEAAATAAAGSLNRRSLGIVAAACTIIAGLTGGLVVWRFRPAPLSPAMTPAQVQIALPPGDRMSIFGVSLAISPDGTKLAYIGVHEGVQQLYVRALDSLEAKAIPGAENADNPFFSPDGRWIAFFAQGKLKKVPVGGGAPANICDVGATDGGASWGENDMIVFSPLSGGLSSVSAAGGQPKVFTTPDASKSEYSHRYPQILPGGKAVIFTALNGFGWDESRIELLRLDTGERRTLVRGGHTGRFLPTGQLVYYRGGSLLAVPFNLSRLLVESDTPVTLVDGILQSTGTVGASYTISATGTLAYIAALGGSRQFDQRLVWVDRQGKIEPLAAPIRAYSGATLSPDGKQIAVTIRSGTEELWIYDLARGSLTRLTSEQGSSITPVWTPDSRHLTYRSNRAGIWNLYWRAADGSGPEERLTTSNNGDTPMSWSPDGKILAFSEVADPGGYNIWTLSLDGDRKPKVFLQTRFDENNARFSPDGHWLAYSSDESGGQQVYVQPYPGPGRRLQISTDGGSAPQWNPNGRELFYRNGNRTMVVDVSLSPSFSAGRPRVLYDGPFGVVSPDGQRFLAFQSVESEQQPTQLNLVLNWFEDVKRRVPTGAK